MKKEFLEKLNPDYKPPVTVDKKTEEKDGKDQWKEEKKEVIKKNLKKKKKKDEKEEESTKKEVEINDDTISKEINELSNQRGHQSKPDETLARIEYLTKFNSDKLLRIQILNLYVNICFDTSPGQFNALNITMWKKIHDTIFDIIDVYDEIISTQSLQGDKLVKNLF